MSIVRYAKILSIVPKLFKLAFRSDELKEIAKKYSGKRSSQVIIYDESGEALSFWAGIEGDEVVIRQGKYPATNTISMHIDTFLDILDKKLDFRTAYAHGLIDLKSHDGLPSFYHFALWASFFDIIMKCLS